MTKLQNVRLFKQAVKSRKWFMFLTPVVTINIDLELLDAIARHMPTADRMEVMRPLPRSTPGSIPPPLEGWTRGSKRFTCKGRWTGWRSISE